MQFIVRTDNLFRGIIESTLLDNGTVADTDSLTPDQYAAKYGYPVRTVDEAELDTMIETYVNSLISDPVEETEADFDYALDVLPPCKWRTVQGVEMFHISERISHNLVSWHSRIGNRFFSFTDRADANMADLATKVAASLAS